MGIEASTLQAEDILEDLTNAESSSRVAEFHAFVAQNYDVMVESERAPGYEAPFGVLMSLCSAEITEENVELFFAEGRTMIARARTKLAEKELQENEGKPDKAEDAAVENIEENPKSKSEASVNTTQEIEERQILQKNPEHHEKKGYQTMPGQIGNISSGIAPRKQLKPNTHKKAEEAGTAGQPEAERGSTTAQTAKPENKVPVIINQPSETAKHTQRKDKKDVDAKQPPTQIETEKSGVIIKLSQNLAYQAARPEDDTMRKSPDIDDQKQKGFITKDSEEELEQEISIEINTFRIDDYVDDEFGEPIKLAADNETSTEDHNGDEVLAINTLIDDAIVKLAASEKYAVPSSAHAAEVSVEIIEIDETIEELPTPAEYIEQTIQGLAKHIEKLVAEEAEEVHQILDDIAIKVEEARTIIKVDTQNQQEYVEPEVKELGVKEDLKKLFIQLFNRAEIEYTSELIKLFVELAIKVDVSELIQEVEREENTAVTQGQATHEIIKHLLAAVASLKRKVLHAFLIGKSALRLYSQELATLKAYTA